MRASIANVALITGAALTLTAAAQPFTPFPLQPESTIWVAGSSTVRDFKCNAKTIDSSLQAPGATANLPLAELVSSAEVSVVVGALDCGNGTMNDHMKKALKAAEFPRVTFALKSYQLATDGQVTLNGTLTMAGRELPVAWTGTAADANGVVRVAGSAKIKMTDWGVKPPSLMMGTMKVKEAVTIGFDVAIKR